MSNNILITGASKGIGFALAKELLSKGHTIISISRSKGRLPELKTNKLITIFADLTIDEDQQNIIKNISSIKNIDIINNAAFCLPVSINKLKYNDLLKHFNTNVISPTYLINEILKTHIVTKVINLSTSAAHSPMESMLPYCISKSAMHHAMGCLSLEYPQVGFANIRPGMVDTFNQEQMRHMPIDTFPSGINFFKNSFEEKKLISAELAAKFIVFVYQKSLSEFRSKYWYIGDYNLTDFEEPING
jgi:benzil reductase ((S)-benzoin forming)